VRVTGWDSIQKRLQELYASAKGALYANSLIQAQAALKEGDFAKTLDLVRASREIYRKRHRKTLQKDPTKPAGKSKKVSKKESRAVEAKQSKIKAALEVFDEVLSHLEKMVKLQRLGRPRPTAQSGTPGGAPLAAQLPGGFQAEHALAETEHARYQVISRYFDIHTVSSDQDIHPETLYFVRGKESYLIRISQAQSPTDLVAMTVVPSGQRMKPVPRRRLLELGMKAQLLRLVPKAPGQATLPSSSAEGGRDSVPDGWQPPAESERSYVDTVIDMGSFTNLLTAAQQSGIVPNADQIAHVRDREFRMGKHQSALDVIERLYVKFNQALAQRQQKLRADEMDYRSGKLKMTPKEWQAKKQRDTAQTQRIERARRNFARVLSGLRVLIASK